MAKGEERRGAYVADPTIGRAAAEQRHLSFGLSDFGRPGFEINGYVVGLDDFYWKVAEIYPDKKISVALVPKGRFAARIHPDRVLDHEDDDVKKKIAEIGERFWQHCREKYLGHTRPATGSKESR